MKRFVKSFFSSFFGIDAAEERAVPHLSDEDTELLASDVQTYYAAKLAKNYRFVNEL
jgi:hypothetical protein